MKKITYLLFFLAVSATAQNTQGVITYEQVIKINTDRFPPDMRSMIPSERKSTSQLVFNENESIYKGVKSDEDINKELSAGNGDRVRFRMRGAGNDSEVYTNVSENKVISQLNFFGRDFLVEGDMKERDWKITGETKMVGQYQAIKATYMRDTVPIEAWFTPQIPVSLGPGPHKGLPGLILYVNVDDGRQTITATNLDLRALKEDELISVPSKGKKVTREQFEKIQKEKMEEMREMNGGRGGTFIIRN